jgi:prolipoprotein diacylglyceryltransferase
VDRAPARARGPLPGVDENAFGDLLFYGMLGVVLGGRIGYVLFLRLQRFPADPLFLLRINEGGMSFHGGLLGVMAAALWWSRRGASISSTPWISSRRWCPRAWASAASATTSAASCGASRPAPAGA